MLRLCFWYLSIVWLGVSGCSDEMSAAAGPGGDPGSTGGSPDDDPICEVFECEQLPGSLCCDRSQSCDDVCVPCDEPCVRTYLICDEATDECMPVGIRAGMQEVCEPCVLDSDCARDLDCVELSFEGASRGGRCLSRTTRACRRPLAFVLSDRVTVSGRESADYCGLNEELTTCEAIAALQEGIACETDADCPRAGVCRMVGELGSSCTYECASSEECPDSSTLGSCASDSDEVEDYCGGSNNPGDGAAGAGGQPRNTDDAP